MEADKPVSEIVAVDWSHVVTLGSDGSPGAFLDVIADAVRGVGLPLLERDDANLTLLFESKGATSRTVSGEETVVVVGPAPSGSQATFTSKGKPSGIVQLRVNADARTWVSQVVPGFGALWQGERR